MTSPATVRLMGLLVIVGVAAASCGSATEVREVVPEAVRDSIHVLEQGSGQEVHDALKALAEMGGEAHAAAPTILTLLGDGPGRQQVHAAHTLLQIGATAEEVVPALAGILGHEDDGIRCEGISLLAEYEEAPQLITLPLVRALTDRSQDVRSLAQATLMDLDLDRTTALPALLEILDTTSDEISKRAAFVLLSMAHLPAEVVPHLVRLLEHEASGMRELGLDCFEVVDGGWDDAVPVMARLLKDPEVVVRAKAARRLALWDRREDEAFQTALDILASRPSDSFDRVCATAALGFLPDDPSGKRIETLIRVLKDDPPRTQECAARSLRRAATLPTEAVPLLRKALAAEYEELRLEAAWALGVHGIHTDAALSVLMNLMYTDSLYCRLRAINALGQIGPAAHVAASALEKLRGDENEHVRKAVTEALDAIMADRE